MTKVSKRMRRKANSHTSVPVSVPDEVEEVVEAVVVSEAEEVVEAVVDDSEVVEVVTPGMGAAPMGTRGGGSWGDRFLIMRLTWLRCWKGRSWVASTTVEVATRMARAIKSVVESFLVNMVIIL